MNNTVLIINSAASRAHKHTNALKKRATKLGIKKIIVTNPDTFKPELVKALKQKPKHLVIGGGDGTVISGIDVAHNKNYAGSFGIIPLGTSNYFARNLRISLMPSKALRQSLKGKHIGIHLAEANKHLFALMADIGASVHISQHVTYDQKKRFGQLAYLLSTFKALKTHSPFGYSLVYDNEQKLEGFCHNILVVNSSLNEQVRLAPDNNLRKDSLTVSIYTGKSNAVLLLNVILYIVTFSKFKRGIKEFNAKKIEINTLPKREFSVDGEVKTKTPVKIKLLDTKTVIATPKIKQSSA